MGLKTKIHSKYYLGRFSLLLYLILHIILIKKYLVIQYSMDATTYTSGSMFIDINISATFVTKSEKELHNFHF